MSRKQFCEHHQLPLTTLDSWKRAEREGAKRSLVAVKIESEPAGNEVTGAFTLTLANGRRIESSWQFRDVELARLIRVAESV